MDWTGDGVPTMDGFSTGDVVLLTAVAYLAVMSFVRLMRQQRDRAIREVNREIKQQAATKPADTN